MISSNLTLCYRMKLQWSKEKPNRIIPMVTTESHSRRRSTKPKTSFRTEHQNQQRQQSIKQVDNDLTSADININPSPSCSSIQQENFETCSPGGEKDTVIFHHQARERRRHSHQQYQQSRHSYQTNQHQRQSRKSEVC